MKKLYERNITLSYIITCLGWGRFFIPVLALFYVASQVPLEQFGVIMGIFFLVILLLEIPSGVIADLIGKKNVIIISYGCYIIELILIAFFNGFWIFLIAKVISGVGVSLTSGASQALLYDSLKKLKREDEHKKISGTKMALMNVSMAIVFIIGAYLFTINYKLPAIASIPFTAAAFFVAFLYKEPYKNKRKLTFKNSFLQFKEGMTYFWNHSYLKYIALLTLVAIPPIAILQSYSSAYFELILIPISLIGVIAFVASMLTAYSSKISHKIEEKIGEKKSLFLIQTLMVIATFTMALMIPYYGVLFYLIVAFVYGFGNVIINHYVNHHVESSHRATMLSINNMFRSMGIFILIPLTGYLIKIKSMSFSFITLGIILVVYLVGLHIFSKNLRIK
ncbi:MFS transporter [archaeon]|nr:MFS transporter [archaeon]